MNFIIFIYLTKIINFTKNFINTFVENIIIQGHIKQMAVLALMKQDIVLFKRNLCTSIAKKLDLYIYY